MDKLLISFGGKPSHGYSVPFIRDWDREVGKLFESAKPYDLETKKYDPDYIYATEFYQQHKDVFDLPHLGWLWKPFIIQEALKEADYVLFLDSNHTLIKSPQPVWDVCDEIGVFCNYHTWKSYPNKDWCTGDCFRGMDCNSQEYWDEPQTCVNMMGFKRGTIADEVVNKWVEYSCNPDVIGDGGKTPNRPGFRQSRWEQAAFSLLRQKMGIPAQPHLLIYKELYEAA